MKAPIHFIHSLNYSHHIFLFKSTLPVALVSWSAATHACYGVTKSCNFCPISATLTLRSTQHPIIINRALLLTVQTRPPWCACARAIHVITWCTVHAVASLRTVSTELSGWAGFNALWTLKSTWTRASSAHWIARSGTNAPEGELDFSETGFQKGWQNIWKRPRRVSKRPLWKRFSIFFFVPQRVFKLPRWLKSNQLKRTWKTSSRRASWIENLPVTCKRKRPSKIREPFTIL